MTQVSCLFKILHHYIKKFLLTRGDIYRPKPMIIIDTLRIASHGINILKVNGTLNLNVTSIRSRDSMVLYASTTTRVYKVMDLLFGMQTTVRWIGDTRMLV